MKFSTSLAAFSLAALAAAAPAAVSAEGTGMALYIGYENAENENAQESAAAKWMQEQGGMIITPSAIDKINSSDLKVIWVNIDRCGMGMGFDKLPEAFRNDEVIDALCEFVEGGGNLMLTKHATQMIAALGRIPEEYLPHIFGDGDGGSGTDVWNVNAHFGSWQLNPDNQEPDPTQVYDRRGHTIYEGMQSFEPWSQWNNCPHSAFPLLGTGDGTEMHREDHNCMWDLNAYTWTADGKNTLEKFEKQFNCETLGTWGHVQDYCVAGIVDFAPVGAIKGRILANGLAAYEWAPRTGRNAYEDNIRRLTLNSLKYLGANPGISGVDEIETAADAEKTYYNLQGIRVANPENGIYIVRQGNKTYKIVVK